MKEIRLFTPGPTHVPQRVRDFLALPMIHHRSEAFEEILKSVRKRITWLCGSQGESVVLASSGTGGMEASIASLFSQGDEVVVVNGGKFGERWEKIAGHFGLKTKVVRVEWGLAARMEEVMDAITPQTKGVLIQACESSTGAYHPIQKLGKALEDKPEILFVVDAITALGVHNLDMQKDRIDVLVCASQKALMTPPGLAIVTLEPRAIDRIQKHGLSFYFSLASELEAQRKNQTAFTPAISLVRALNEALAMIEREGKEALYKRHLKMQKMAREGFRAMGLELFNTDEEATWGITVVRAPTGLEVKPWLSNLKKDYDLWLAGGQAELEGKIFRVSHMGALTLQMLWTAIRNIEETLNGLVLGAQRQLGSQKARTFLES